MLTGAYEKNGKVILECDDGPNVELSWREAMARCRAVSIAEKKERWKNRSLRIQKLIEQMVVAAVAARKKVDPKWSPPASVLGVATSKKASHIIVPGDYRAN